jgi:hypothetical protein
MIEGGASGSPARCYGVMEEPDGTSRTVLLGVETWQPAGTKGLPPAGLRDLLRDRAGSQHRERLERAPRRNRSVQ